MNCKAVYFDIISTRIIADNTDSNKHVVYTVQVRHLLRKDDIHPVCIERRYTNFLNLYLDLKQAFPNLLAPISFPRKILIGNFDEKLITTRSTEFERFLNSISSEPTLLNAPPVLTFLRDIEQQQAKELMNDKQYDAAVTILEISFRTLSKVYTDRSKPVLLALCRLLICCASRPGAPNAEKWAELLLDRYNGVSDDDLLTLYVPLLYFCIKLTRHNEPLVKTFEQRLENLHRQGINIKNPPSLMDALVLLENK